MGKYLWKLRHKKVTSICKHRHRSRGQITLKCFNMTIRHNVVINRVIHKYLLNLFTDTWQQGFIKAKVCGSLSLYTLRI